MSINEFFLQLNTHRYVQAQLNHTSLFYVCGLFEIAVSVVTQKTDEKTNLIPVKRAE